MEKPKVYLETSVISYLTARPSRDIVKLAKQQLTREWWETRRRDFEVFLSVPVMTEIQRGDAEAARLRTESVMGLPVLVPTDQDRALGDRLVSGGAVPQQAKLDALHIAIAAVHGIHVVLTWNCAHISNFATRKKVTEILMDAGYSDVVTATPEEVLRSEHNGKAYRLG